MTPRVREQIKALKFHARMMRKVKLTSDGHWLWQGTKYSDKYGMYQYAITQQDNNGSPSTESFGEVLTAFSLVTACLLIAAAILCVSILNTGSGWITGRTRTTLGGVRREEG